MSTERYGLIERRRLLAIGAGVAMAAAVNPKTSFAAADDLPVDKIKGILQAPGTVENGVLDISIGRKDLHGVSGPVRPGSSERIPFSSGFELNGDFTFQAIGDGNAIMNADFAFLAHEIEPAIDAMARHGLELQALHQHYPGIEPMVWFMHFRGHGPAERIAQGAAAVIRATATPLPQHEPAQKTTTLPKDEIGRILGAKPDVGDDGVVELVVPRTDSITLAGVRVKPQLNVSTNVVFQMLPDGRAAAAPDFSMTAGEVMPVLKLMRAHEWSVDCLYNQETDEHPQLYFSHMLKLGEPLALAREIRSGLDQTAAQRAGDTGKR